MTGSEPCIADENILNHNLLTNIPTYQILKVVEKSSKDIQFNFQDHLLGGVSQSATRNLSLPLQI